jgi:hypothetical protein
MKKISIGIRTVLNLPCSTFRAQIERFKPLGHQASHISSLNWID